MSANQALIDQLPFWHPDEEGITVYKDGSLGLGFKLEGLDISSSANERLNEVASLLENALSALKDNLKLQFFYRLTPHVGVSVGGTWGSFQGGFKNTPPFSRPDKSF